MHCPGCGKPVSEGAKWCPSCGHPVGDGVSLARPSVASEKKGMDPAIIASVIVVVAVTVIGVIALLTVFASSHDLRADLSFYASNSWLGLGSSGDVEVWGYIYNYGSSSCLGTLHLSIYDGYSWHKYTELLGLINGNGGSVYFSEVYYFDALDSDAVQVKYELSGD
jgi:hypothetical protein